MRLVDSRDDYHCPVLFSRSTDFAAPPVELDFARVGCLNPSSRVGQ